MAAAEILVVNHALFFADLALRQGEVAELNPRFGNAHIVTFDRGDRVFYRVRVGKCISLAEASAYEEQLMRNGFPDAFAVAE